jgi:hypothetical protein
MARRKTPVKEPPAAQAPVSVPSTREPPSPSANSEPARSARAALLQKIEQLRGSRVIAYICSDRQGAAGQIGEDAVRPMYDHIRPMGKVEAIDLYLYSRGGAVEVPWRIISMLREHCSKLGVLVPYRAQSAATLIALGCDEIVMGAKAELGPIDPAISRINQESGTAIQEEIRVEDVMSYVSFIKQKAGLGDQTAIAENVRLLADKLSPWVVGSIYRTHSHIRMVARKLLGCHKSRVEEQRANLIIEALAEKIYLHGHAVGRSEAEELGLKIVRSEEALENAMWQLLEEYEGLMQMRRPVDVEAALGPNQDETDISTVLAVIESVPSCWAFRGTLQVQRVRQAPSQVNININIGVALPPGIDQNLIPQEVVQQIIRQVQNDIPGMVAEQTRRQSPVLRTEGRLQGAHWQDVTAEGL